MVLRDYNASADHFLIYESDTPNDSSTYALKLTVNAPEVGTSVWQTELYSDMSVGILWISSDSLRVRYCKVTRSSAGVYTAGSWQTVLTISSGGMVNIA